MPLTLAQKFINLGMAAPLAVEYANQLTSGSYNWKRLMWLGMIPQLAKYVTTSIVSGEFNPKSAVEKTMTEAVALLTQQSATVTPIISLGTTGFQIGPISRGTQFVLNATTRQTMQVTAEIRVPSFKRVRMLIANTTNAARGVLGMSIAVLPSAADLNGASATHVQCFVGGSPTCTPAATPGADQNITITKTDWTNINSLARTDGGRWPLILGRVYEGSAFVKGLGDGVTDYTNWATRTDGWLWACRYSAGNCCAGTGTPANFNNSVNRSQTTIAGFEFETANGEIVCTMLNTGDSIAVGSSASGQPGNVTYTGEGYLIPAITQLQSQYPNVSFVPANLGWEGSDMSTFVQRQGAAIAAGLVPNIAIFSNGSPNNANTPIIDGNITSMTTQRDLLLSAANGAGAKSIVWTWLPTNPAVKDYNSSDVKRRDYDAATIANATAGNYTIADFNAVLSGVTDADGQVNMLAGSTNDDIHPNDYGNGLLAPVLATSVKRVVFGA